MFKFIKTRIKHRELLREHYAQENILELEFIRVQAAMNLFMNTPQSKVLIEYLEAKVETARDALELNTDVTLNQARLEAYRELLSLFQEVKDSHQAQSKPSSD